jgi:hypothetical protein
LFTGCAHIERYPAEDYKKEIQNRLIAKELPRKVLPYKEELIYQRQRRLGIHDVRIGRPQYISHWWSIVGDDKHCFKDTSSNKEILTVRENHVEAAIIIFHERLTKGDYLIERSRGGVYMEKTFKEGVEFELEMASCAHRERTWRDWWRVKTQRFISFRLKD